MAAFFALLNRADEGSAKKKRQRDSWRNRGRRRSERILRSKETKGNLFDLTMGMGRGMRKGKKVERNAND